MQIEIKERTKVKANIYGKEYALHKPTVGQIESMQDKIKADDKRSLAIMMEFASVLGLPLEIASGMEVDHFTQLIEELCGTKKK